MAPILTSETFQHKRKMNKLKQLLVSSIEDESKFKTRANGIKFGKLLNKKCLSMKKKKNVNGKMKTFFRDTSPLLDNKPF